MPITKAILVPTGQPTQAALSESTYYALVYSTTTGAVVSGPIPDANRTEPTWLQQINNPGMYTWQTFVDGKTLTKDQLLTYIQGEWRFGLAICYGNGSPNDVICQAGPITSSVDLSESPPVVRIGGTGFWSLLSACWQIDPTWNGSSFATAGNPTALKTYNSSLQGIASLMATDAITANTFTSRGTLPLDVPAPIAGTATRTFYAYEGITVGQRLSELTQVQNGPDVMFVPYFSAPNTIRHKMVIGNPTITQPGVPLVFTYPGSIRSILRSRDASRLTTFQLEAGGGGLADQALFVFAQDNTLPLVGYPALFASDASHTDVVDRTTLTQWAQGNLGVNGRPAEMWAAVTRMNANPKFGTYTPGVYAQYSVQDHPTIRDGSYSHRMIGFGSGAVSTGGSATVTPGVGEIVHILQNTAGQV